jgi:purine catabolism regulator
MSLRSHGLPDALRVGLGQELEGPAGARDSYREAVAASAFAQVSGQRVLFYEDAGVYRWIAPLARNGDALALALVDLATVIEYDRQNHTQLLETLKVYLDCDRSKQQTAARLFIHRQTLYHRLEQLGRLLRADLDDPVQRLGVHLAVYAYLYHRQCGDREDTSK